MKNSILFKRGYIEESTMQVDGSKTPFFVTKLLNSFGIVVDKPEKLTEKEVKFISKQLGTDIPSGFYANPQDLEYFSAEELIIEQFISYLQIALNGSTCLDEKVFERNEVFKKVLPTYHEGDEVKLRKYKIVNLDETKGILLEITRNLCSYTRPWSIDELEEFNWLYLNGYYNEEYLSCKDNAISMFLKVKDIHFASMLDKKDIVKMSLDKFGQRVILDFSDEDKTIFNLALSVAKDCPMSLKQAKYYNRILKNVNSDLPLANNGNSVYKKAIKLIKSGKILDAAKVYANNGSLLQRNLVFLLSRASLDECKEILDLIKIDNPIVLIQLVTGIMNNNDKRTFSFISNKRFKSHTETCEEIKKRKSILSSDMKENLINTLDLKIKAYYQNKKSLGKIYISPIFKKVALPINTSAMGMGIDVLPTGSRLPIKFDYLRAFCYWHKVFDIDASVVFVDKNTNIMRYYWGNMSSKQFGNSCLCSGDNRDKDGAEYCDFKISELVQKGFEYAIYTLNGYGGDLNMGEIYCGLQNKKNLKTKAFDPKNIEFKIHVKGDSRGYIGFAIDFNSKEIIFLNQIIANDSRVVNGNVVCKIQKYLTCNFLKNYNMYKLLSYMGEIVDNVKDADIVFDSSIDKRIKNKQLITPFNIEKLVTLLK